MGYDPRGRRKLAAETGIDAGRAAALDARFAGSCERLEARRTRALAAMRDALPRDGTRLPAVRRLYLFGSVVIPGAFRSDSDVGIDVDGDLSADEFLRSGARSTRSRLAGKPPWSSWIARASTLRSGCARKESWCMRPEIQTFKAEIR